MASFSVPVLVPLTVTETFCTGVGVGVGVGLGLAVDPPPQATVASNNRKVNGPESLVMGADQCS